MVNVTLINIKITDRAVKMLIKNIGITNYEYARILLMESGSVKKAMDSYTHHNTL
jgi:N-acetylmuramic acid 6-phosphate etherase